MTSWRASAACLNKPLNVFFPDTAKQDRPAKQVCAACPVNVECFTYAATERITFGVWGGVNCGVADERRAAQRTLGRACMECGEVFRHPDLLVVCCSEDCWRLRRDRQKRQSRQRRRNAA